MKKLLEYVLKQIVNNPKSITVEEQVDPEDPTFVKLLITADEEDRGLIKQKSKTRNSRLIQRPFFFYSLYYLFQ
jgi:predicted RNA-binding protein YlqC (UPF0109 family)